MNKIKRSGETISSHCGMLIKIGCFVMRARGGVVIVRGGAGYAGSVAGEV